MRHRTRCAQVRTVHRSFFDRLILPRVEQYAINHDLHDLDAAVNYLRTNYREYRRHKEDPFRKIVLRAIQTLQHNNARENSKRKRFHDDEEDEEEEEEEEASSSGDSDSSGSQFELNQTSFPGLMNSVLRTNYGTSANASSPKPTESTKSTEDNTKMDINAELCSENGNELDGVISNTKEIQEPQGGLDKKLKKEDKGSDSRVMFKDLGGLSGVINEVMEIIYPLFHPEIYPWLGVQPMKGILLHGPPGCGKTKLAHAIANEAGVPFYKISATEVVSGVSGMIRITDIV